MANKNIVFLGGAVLLVGVLSLTVISLQERQNIRQEASSGKSAQSSGQGNAGSQNDKTPPGQDKKTSSSQPEGTGGTSGGSNEQTDSGGTDRGGTSSGPDDHAVIQENNGPERVFEEVPFDMQEPDVTILKPANNSVVKRNSSVAIEALASDNIAVTKVEFLINGGIICTLSAAPYQCVWSVPSTANISYAVAARAYDRTGNVSSASVVVTAR